MQSNENIILSDNKKPEFKIIEIGDYSIGFFIAKNETKNDNEDCLFVKKEKSGLVIGVSDGAGGHPRGKDASFLTASMCFKEENQVTENKPHPIELIEMINQGVTDLKVGAKCTLLFVTIKEDIFKSYSVGDSEVIYWNSIGNEIYTNIPHSVVGYSIEAGVLEQEASLDEDERHIVNNLIGDTSIRIEATSGVKMKKGHTILLGSDGLFDNLSHDSLNEIVMNGSFDKCFDDLVKKCIERDKNTWKKDDDISFVLIKKTRS